MTAEDITRLTGKMPCHITDGPPDPDAVPKDYEEIDMTKEWRQMEVDEKAIADSINEAMKDIFGTNQAD